MALWKDSNTSAAPAQTFTPPGREPARDPAPPQRVAASPAAAPAAAAPAEAARPRERELKESVVAAGLSIEGKIEGSGHVRIAGRFKGDVNVEGDLTIDQGAHVAGQVNAATATIAGELQGNVSARRVEVLQTGMITGDVKAGSLTVAAGSRMRGQVEFGWDDKGSRPADTKARGTA